MENKTTNSFELAGNAFKGDQNCSQSVLMAYSNHFGLSGETAQRIASGFGGGIALSGNMCGAVTGGIMVIGLAGTGEGSSKLETYERSKQFMKSFEDKYGSLQCGKLVEPRENKDDKRFCDKFVEGAALIIDEILEIK